MNFFRSFLKMKESDGKLNIIPILTEQSARTAIKIKLEENKTTDQLNFKTQHSKVKVHITSLSSKPKRQSPFSQEKRLTLSRRPENGNV